MASTQELIQTLKSELRLQQITYAQIGGKLQLSESSIKRLFSTQDMSISRLESICNIANIDILQLATKAVKQRQHVLHLTRQYEQDIIGDEKLMLVTVHLVYGWSYEKIIRVFNIDRFEGQHLLTRLDQMGVIELLPHNKVRILLSTSFKWIENGPIQTFFEKEIQSEFFKSGFNREGEMRLVSHGWMSLDRLNAFHEKMIRVAKEFELELEQDRHIPVENRMGTTMVVAIRPWVLSLFERYRRAGK